MSQPTSARRATATAFIASRRSGAWTRSCSPTSWSSTTWFSDEPYDLWIGDEAWELDYFLHENPELKTASYAWLSDFVGWLPTDSGGAQEAMLTADYNAEMLEQMARFPRVRDRAIFVGEPDDIVAADFGPELPEIRGWTERPLPLLRLRHRCGAAVAPSSARRSGQSSDRGPDERVCIVTVGGSGVGSGLLRRVARELPEARRQVPELRMVWWPGRESTCGALPGSTGWRSVAMSRICRCISRSCDLAIVQGGLATTMELTAARRPFIYVPLEQHFEQNGHVRHRLERYRAGRRLEFADATRTALAHGDRRELGREVDYLPVPVDGAARAAAMIAELL